MLSISGLVWNVFSSSVFRGRDKGLNGTSPIDRDLGIEAMQYELISPGTFLLGCILPLCFIYLK